MKSRNSHNTIKENTIKIYLITVKSFSTKKTKTDLQDCRVGVTIDIDKVVAIVVFAKILLKHVVNHGWTGLANHGLDFSGMDL